MKLKALLIAALLFPLFGFVSSGFFSAQAQSLPTPTYDPLGEPPLPKNPTQLETGRHLYWRHCMPCHGDVGQGLTDEFRVLWDDHANCWESGCHGGRGKDEGFPIPTVLPALTNTDLPTRYTPNSLFEFLRVTHPPQDPGLLSDDDYRAVVVFLYHLNGTTLPITTATWTPSSPPSFTPTPELLPSTESDSPFGLWPVIGLAVILTMLVLIRETREGG